MECITCANDYMLNTYIPYSKYLDHHKKVHKAEFNVAKDGVMRFPFYGNEEDDDDDYNKRNLFSRKFC